MTGTKHINTHGVSSPTQKMAGNISLSPATLCHFKIHIGLAVGKIRHRIKHYVLQVEFNWFVLEALAIHSIVVRDVSEITKKT